MPRLCAGGVIVCDDYAALMFPGSAPRLDRSCEKNGLGFVALDTGQSVILKV